MIFSVKAPIPGFETIKEVELEKIDEFFVKFISKSDPTTFTLINPFMLRPYEFEIPEYFRTLLEINEKSNILILNIMIIATPIETSTINFIAPLVFNVDNQSLAQVVLDANQHPDFGLMESISLFLNKEKSE
ncbi:MULTISPECIES: flagellar assembly protein FliW [Sulfurospirillum]|uniref:Flagellar assembly factor FliW n=3 Tax=Sulfurospirillum TaxID=57665 RepID=A0A1D7TIU5_9BACT|nr:MULTISPECIES: flagellar assembly protein FliW [Sulfurospirillum]AHJ12360.1 flagellar assembly factor FliW [Sulfurospirillum multivorans DSM 12446]AOO64896.1 flagellar assembly factor FliW [Sulfurospirillum halorespirans DSM 13726]QEH05858.1 flagellar assembly factor FliW [Sulfurospirillum multivorans]